MYFNISQYSQDFAPSPSRAWEQINDNTFHCAAGNAVLVVFRNGEGKVWWAEGSNPSFESATWFWTAEQAMYWAEKTIEDWFI